MMKFIKNISLLALLFVMLVGCVEKTPDYENFASKDVDFTYGVAGDEYKTDFYVVSEIQFNNVSSKSGAVKWEFGDGETSTEANPVHKYASAGNYKVTLTVEGVGSCTYPILIYDIAPVLSITSQSAETILINDVSVELGIELPNPENLICKYVWILPEGTTNEAGEEITEFIGYSHEDGSIDYPGKLKFKHIGSQKIQIQTWFDVAEGGENRRLSDSYVNVQVGSSVPGKTIYYAVYGGNIKAYKLIDKSLLPEGTKVLPFDMGLSSGSTPQNLVFARVKTTDEEGVVSENGWLYILDCGKQYYYINDEAGVLGDGKVSVMSQDGSVSNVVVSNVGQTAFNDPFVGCASGDYLLYTDRNTGVRKIELAARGETQSADAAAYLVQNNWVGYYNLGIAYGAISSAIAVDSKGTYWWAKNYNGNGIYRFTASQIYPDAKPIGGLPNAIVLPSAQPKAFALDETRGKMYVYMVGGEAVGFCEYPLPADQETLKVGQYTKRIAMSAAAENSTASEGLFVTQFAVDSEDGKVYFGFRSDGDANYTTGLKYYDPETQKIGSVNDNAEKILGVAINDEKTLLF